LDDPPTGYSVAWGVVGNEERYVASIWNLQGDVNTRQGGGDLVVAQQALGTPNILGDDECYLSEDPYRMQGQIFGIALRCTDDVECTHRS
jgi:hypothetical protein